MKLINSAGAVPVAVTKPQCLQNWDVAGAPNWSQPSAEERARSNQLVCGWRRTELKDLVGFWKVQELVVKPHEAWYMVSRIRVSYSVDHEHRLCSPTGENLPCSLGADEAEEQP
jgi:hypothetical protein